MRDRLDELHKLAAILIERETIDRDQFEQLLAGKAPSELTRERVAPPALRSRAA